jgi:hypothetical protein
LPGQECVTKILAGQEGLQNSNHSLQVILDSQASAGYLPTSYLLPEKKHDISLSDRETNTILLKKEM